MSIGMNCSPFIGYYLGAQSILFREEKSGVVAEANSFFSQARSLFPLADSVFQNLLVPEEVRQSPKSIVRWLLKTGFTPSIRQKEIVFLPPRKEKLSEDISIEKPDPGRSLFYCTRSIEFLLEKGVTIPLLPSMQGREVLEDTKNFSRFMELAKELDQEGKHQQAISMFDIAFAYTENTSDFALLPTLLAKTDQPNRAALAYLYLAKRHLEENQFGLAEEAMKKAYDLLPQEEIQASYAANLMLNDKYEDAHHLFRELGRQTDKSTEEGKQKALLYWEQAVESNPRNPEVYAEIAPYCENKTILANLYLTGSLHLKETNPEHSKELEEKARDLDPTNPLLYLSQLSTLDENQPEFIVLCRKIGKLFKKRGDLSTSLYYLEIAARSDSYQDLNRLNKLVLKLASIEEEGGNRLEAEKIYRVAHKKKAGFESSFRLATLLSDRNNSKGVRLFYNLSGRAMLTQELDKVSRCLEQIRFFDPHLKTLKEQEQQILSTQALVVKLFDQLVKTQQELLMTQKELASTQQKLAPLLEREAERLRLEEAEAERLRLEQAEKLQRLQQMAFGAEKWAKYFGEVGAEPPLPPDILDILSGPCPIWPGKTIGETHKLVLVPQTLDGPPLTLDRLGELIERPRQGKTTKYRYYEDALKKKLGSTSLPSHWILMTKEVLPGSGKPSHKQVYDMLKAQVASLRGGYQVPRLLEAAVCILMEHVETGTRLFETIMRCQEEVEGYPALVGGFSADGLGVYGRTARDWDYGVAGLRIF